MSIDIDLQFKIKVLEQNIAENTKKLLERANAWRYLIYSASSYNEPLSPGDKDSDIILTQHQCSEFAISYTPDSTPDTLIVLAQPSNFEWMTKIGISAAILSEDGITFIIEKTDEYGIYIAGKTIKISTSPLIAATLRRAKITCKHIVLACMEHSFNSQKNVVNWKVSKIHHEHYPIFTSFISFKHHIG